MIFKTIYTGSTVSREAILPEDRKEFVAGKEVIGKDSVFEFFFIKIFAG